MATVREVCTDALIGLKALAPGDSMVVDEQVSALTALRQVLLEWHGARGPMIDVDVTTDYVAGENQRVRIQDGYVVEVELPNSVLISTTGATDRTDYGFSAPTLAPLAGSLASADGVTWRQPRDGARIEIVGTAEALWFYTADNNAWVSVYDIGLDDTVPVNRRDIGHWGARVAERMIDAWPALFEPTPSLLKRIARANSALLYRPGVARDPVTSQYF